MHILNHLPKARDKSTLSTSLDSAQRAGYTRNMSFRKALQKNKPPGYDEYAMALVIYKQACSDYNKARRRWEPLEKEDRLTNQQTLMWYRAQRTYKQACVEYKTARSLYEKQALIFNLEAQGLKPSEVDINKLLGIHIPTTFSAIIAEDKRQRIAASVSQEDIEMAKQVMEERQKRKSGKDSFLSPREDKTDPTLGDFEPI
jgi:hypothetical protein